MNINICYNLQSNQKKVQFQRNDQLDFTVLYIHNYRKLSFCGHHEWLGKHAKVQKLPKTLTSQDDKILDDKKITPIYWN